MKKLFLLCALIFAVGAAVPARAQGNHEYAPLQEQTVNYKDWTFNSIADGHPVNLRQLAAGKKLVLVVYFAAWCPNWRNESPTAAALYEKYKANGLEVVGVSEYATSADARNFFGPTGAPYTVVSESEGRDARDKTSHYGYRKTTGDNRNWGSPWNIFLEPSKFAKGDVLAEKAWVVNGELIEADVEKFVRERLGLKPEAAPQKKAQLDLKIETDKDKMVRDSLSTNTNAKTNTPCKQ